MLRSQGADVTARGVRYRTWCKHDCVEAVILEENGNVSRVVPLRRDADGYHSAIDEAGRAGDLYKYRFGKGEAWPDPASRYQPFGVHGPSAVVDSSTYTWKNTGWVAPHLNDLVIYELHIGTFTAEGTFCAAMERLAHVAAVGVTAIELMPVGDFPGERNWGYDGVMLYAPARAYGTPDDLRALVDAAHSLGLAVILDVVYNHFGPDGNYTSLYHPEYFSEAKPKTPWGAALNYECGPVRAFFLQNPAYWMDEFHIDGFRLDATHAIKDSSRQHILLELAESVHAHGGFMIAEDDRNEPNLLKSTKQDGLGLDAVWADDFHHVTRVCLTQEQESYYANFAGSSQELVETLKHGWLFRGQQQKTSGRPRGGDPTGLLPRQFIYCILNHDQVGNRAFGERLNHTISAAGYRAASALLCLVPQTPMLFMGQEWATSSPFQFFIDHKPDLAKSISEGRRREFGNFAAFRDPALLESIPDPQAVSTFARSKLNWDELAETSHAGILLLYRELLRLRREHEAFQTSGREFAVLELVEGVVAIVFGCNKNYTLAVITDLVGGHAIPDLNKDSRTTLANGGVWQLHWSSNEARFGGEDTVSSRTPVTLVFKAT